MADEPSPIDRNDQVRHASDDAREAARKKMQAALEAQRKGEDIDVESAGISATVEDAGTSGKSQDSAAEKSADNDPSIIKKVKVYSPFKVYYDEEAKSVSAVNLTGPFDILAGHKSFMTLLIEGDIVIRSPRGEERITIDRGVMHVRNNQVTVFLDV